ncbi:MAG: BON domain-containing protein [Vulcanimicrobiaceae bacterium]
MLTLTSEELRDDVLAELDLDPQVDSSRIGVAVQDGIVTLTGKIPTLSAKWAAEEAVGRVKGVRGIAQEMEIDLPATHVRDDSDIARAAAEALAWDSTLSSPIQVRVQDGRVTLRGEVEWHYQRTEAEQVVRRLVGVREIIDLLTLRPSVSAGDIRAHIQRAFHRFAQFDANRIKIHTDGGTVTLTGSVPTWFERNRAWQAAWTVPGVAKVENRITVG